MNNSIPLRIKQIMACVLALLAAVIALLVWHSLTFHVVSTNPTTNKVSTTAPFFKINFNEPIKSGSVVVTSSPGNILGNYSVSGKTITILFRDKLVSKANYTITLVRADSISGKKITSKTFSFKPYFITSADLPADQRAALLQAEDIGGVSATDPIIKHLPRQTTDFILDRDSTPTGDQDPSKFPLDAQIILSQADTGNPDAAAALYKQEVLDYITSLGLNPANYAITYDVQTP